MKAVEAVFDSSPDKPLAEMRTFLEPIGYYGHVEHVGRLNEFFNSNDTVFLSELPNIKFKHSEERLEYLKEILGRYDIDPIVIDCSHSQMSQVKVVKVFIQNSTASYKRISLLRSSADLRTSHENGFEG